MSLDFIGELPSWQGVVPGLGELALAGCRQRLGGLIHCPAVSVFGECFYGEVCETRLYRFYVEVKAFAEFSARG
jgi:hypothetical protein